MWYSSVINVWFVKVGDKYREDHIDALAHMVRKNLRRDFQFNVIRESGYPGWWAKIDLHKHAAPGPNLYIDLDTVIVGDITPLVEYYSGSWLAMPKNWAKSGHGGFQSSVMIWGGKAQDIYNDFDITKVGEPDGPENCRNHGWYTDEGLSHWGDQELITHRYRDKITEIQAGQVVSYKYHCLESLPKDAKIVCFHGKPDYWEVQHDWITRALS